MSDKNKQLNNWKSVLDHKTQILYSQIAQMQSELSALDTDTETINMLCQPYYELLESIYTEDYPLANAIENSDLVVRLEGSGVDKDKPRISLISSYFGKVRKQITNVAKAIADLDENKRSVKEFDLTLTAFAKGSLVLGFSLPRLEDLEENGQPSLLGEEEPLFKAAREAMKTLGVVSHFISNNASLEEIAEAVPDAKVRDIALSALNELAPSGRKGISSVSIAGKEIGQFEEGKLTKSSRENVQKILKHPVSSKENTEFSGQVREIDLDAQRLELRHIENNLLNEVRCIYSNYSDSEASNWLNKVVKIKGLVERDSSGKARLMEIESVVLG
jgi:hypothetical protein